MERKRILGTLIQDEKSEYKVVAEGKTYKTLLASLTYYKAEPGDSVTLLVPADQESSWAAVENVIKKGAAFDERTLGPVHTPTVADWDESDGGPGELKQVRILAGDDDET